MHMHLVQRFIRPFADSKKNKTWQHAFGGGYTYGGLSRADVEKLSQVFQPDYIGAAEYEFGDLAASYKRFQVRAKAGELIGVATVAILGSSCKVEAPIYMVCHGDVNAAVEAIALLAGNDYLGLLRTYDSKTWKNKPPRDNPYLRERLLAGADQMKTEYGIRTLPVAWWDIHNDVLWSVDKNVIAEFLMTLPFKKGKKKDERNQGAEAQKPARRRNRKA